MSGAPVWLAAVDWLGTFAVHSSCALGTALSVGLVLRDRARGWQEQWLRVAMWLPLLSSTAQMVWFGSPQFLPLPALPALPPLAEMPWFDAPQGEGMAGAASNGGVGASTGLWSVPALAGLAAVAAAFGGLCWLARSWWRLRGVLQSRRPERSPALLVAAAEVAARLGLQQSPRLSRSDRLGSSIAFGWVRPEVCLPRRVDELGPGSLRALLGHELAHLHRADPAWTWGAALLQALFPWQLLLLAARRRWSRLVELECDAVAARLASPTEVAHCLLDVASWCEASHRPVVALAMAARPSALRQRVEAVLRSHGGTRPSRWASAWLGLGSLAALVGAAPGMAGAPLGGWARSAAVEEPVRLDALAGSSAAPNSAAEATTLGAAAAAPSALPDAALAVGPVPFAAAEQALVLLDQQRRELQSELQQLRAELVGRRHSAEIDRVLQLVELRLSTVQRLRDRLRLQLDRQATARIPNPRR
jgi:beta-lactamase regulating signal transducer with metallopeptidase domain